MSLHEQGTSKERVSMSRNSLHHPTLEQQGRPERVTSVTE